MFSFWRIAAALALALPTAAAAQEERIHDFDSVIAVHKDGTLDVTESIRVNAEHIDINHGIYRDFPTRYAIPNGGRMKVGFNFLDATLDGQAVESSVESVGNGVRIKLGSADSIVSQGEHLYRIHYKVDRELGFFKDYDELYWNVTGNGWLFPIDHATATITLPSPARFGQRAVYTGSQGSTDTNAEVIEDEPGKIVFATTEPLSSYEGLTVAAAFPKGVVEPPSAQKKLGWFILDMLPLVASFATLGAVALFLFYAWRRAGRDPAAGTVVPLFAPPEGMSPAAMRYVLEQGFDNRAFAAAIVEAGVKGHLKLVEEGGFLGFGGEKYIEGTDTPTSQKLGSPEGAAINTLVSPGERLDLDNKNHATFSAAKNVMSEAFKTRFDGKAFNRNYGWVGGALGIWAVGAYLTALAVTVADGHTSPIMLLPLAGIPIVFFVYRWLRPSWNFAGCLGGGLVGVPTLLIGGFVAMNALAQALSTERWQPLVVCLIALLLAISMAFWISSPTKEGRALLDQIAGFKQYLSTTERERFDRMQAPAETLELFERYLPYAIALGVENRWADHFQSQLAAAAAAGAGQQGFAWYSGSHSPWSDASGFTSSVGSALSSSISSASTAPGSSSGSGGGGSSA